MKLLWLLSLILSLFTYNEYNITGIVYDSKTNEKLVGVCVISDSDTSYTDLNGRYMLKSHDDTVSILIEYISYENLDTTYATNKYLKTNKLDFFIKNY